MAFSFRNMQAFIRNCIEPHVVALNTHIKTNRIWTAAEIEDLKKQNKIEMDQLKALIKQQIENQNTQITEKINSITSICVGWIGFWPTNVAPEDVAKWLMCDGSRFNQSIYPKLFNVLKSASLPDYRGYFLRCVGGNSSSLGVHQDMMIQAHTHPVNLWTHNAAGGGIWSYTKNGGPDGSIKAQSTGGVETRPINKAVQYWIRALD